jgi:hypothetical protein
MSGRSRTHRPFAGREAFGVSGDTPALETEPNASNHGYRSGCGS